MSKKREKCLEQEGVELVVKDTDVRRLNHATDAVERLHKAVASLYKIMPCDSVLELAEGIVRSALQR